MTLCHQRKTIGLGLSILFAAGCCSLGGCQDGPLYALKAANPWFAMKEWREDEAFGVTDHQRREQLTQLANSIDELSAERQQFWAGQLRQIMENDQSPEMRRLAILASGKMSSATEAVPLIEMGLDDDSMKVRMEACRALGRIDDAQSSQMLAATYGSETNQDVRHAAIESLSQHKNPTSVNSLRLALDDRNPATRDLTMQSLRDVTGKDLGGDAEAWIAELEKGSTDTLGVTDSLMR
ncbi:HEAT repeat domain-containing protein [Novipirellula artificiosorum]|uniref:HEAT repeat protein n=1 Tax=Novipirellula artificiosorum TaxID=2528016 RepID=A0A5C6DYB0_9BACT|nr:HEAT repeat domain-containing protein [Novipirellula artificiosorum]TWU42433.1 HEAT repeat protein [Novipirellula artificiosorum]